MGLLSQGSPLNWEETKKHADHVRKHGILQFLNIYNKVKERQKDVLKWGDEVRLLSILKKCTIFCENTWLRFLEKAFSDALDQIWMLHVSRCTLCVMNIVSFMHAHFLKSL